MTTLPILILLLTDLLIFAGAAFLWDKSPRKKENLLLSALFLSSGIPALVYQVVWQRSLFAIYGVNAESVAAVVSAFMLGLGLGGLLGGWLSARFPRHSIILFGVAELGVAVFGLFSLRIFHWAASLSAGVGLPGVILFSLLLLVLPTLLMGATLPLLVEHLVLHSGRVGLSVSRLYFANTLGSAIGCYCCATFLLRDFGQAGSVTIAACINTIVGASAYLYGRQMRPTGESMAQEVVSKATGTLPLFSLWKAMVLAALSGFIALGFEIIWFRVFALASGDRAPAFALLLSTYLAGIAAGAYLSEKLTEGTAPEVVLRTMGVLLLVSGALSPFLPPFVAHLLHTDLNYLWSALLFFLVAGMAGCVLPLLCQLSVGVNDHPGRQVSFIYASNIIGAVFGSLGIGFLWLQYAGLRTISLGLAFLAVTAGAIAVLFMGARRLAQPVWVWVLLLSALVALPLAWPCYNLLFEHLTFGKRQESDTPFARIVENRNGVVAVTQEDAVFGGGVYDGHFRINPVKDVNVTVRAFTLMGIHQAPKRVLMIGLASGSWAQILINDPRVLKFDVVEINPGYLKLIPEYPVVSSLLTNEKLRLFVDDGRRWLIANPAEKYDVIVANASYHWRDHSTTLLSKEFYQLIREHLNPGGIYYFNSTESDEAIATALTVFPHGLRIVNFLAVSDSPITLDRSRWLAVLAQLHIDGKAVFDLRNPGIGPTWEAYGALPATLNAPPRFFGLEGDDSLRSRLGRQRLISDDNMGREWDLSVALPWRQ